MKRNSERLLPQERKGRFRVRSFNVRRCPPSEEKEKKLSEEVGGGGDAIKLAIKTVDGSYGTLASFVRLPAPQW